MLSRFYNHIEWYASYYNKREVVSITACFLILLLHFAYNILFSVVFAFLHIPEMTMLNLVTVAFCAVAIYLVLIKHKLLLSSYMFVLSVCSYVIVSTYILGYDKNAIILFPVLALSIQSLLPFKGKHLVIQEAIIFIYCIFTFLIKFEILSKYEGSLGFLEIVNTFFALSFSVFVLQTKTLSERFVDVYSNKKLENLSTEIYTDFVTGLWNRRFMENLFLKETNFDDSYVAMADIDLFKLVNDTYGHPAGDLIIKEVSDIFLSVLRKTDYVSRWGGEEFLFYVKNTDKFTVLNRFEEIRSKIENRFFQYEDKALRITITLGVKKMENGLGPAKNIADADAALYYGKNNGRNRVVYYDDVIA